MGFLTVQRYLHGCRAQVDQPVKGDGSISQFAKTEPVEYDFIREITA